jgi:hypothetical protein
MVAKERNLQSDTGIFNYTFEDMVLIESQKEGAGHHGIVAYRVLSPRLVACKGLVSTPLRSDGWV